MTLYNLSRNFFFNLRPKKFLVSRLCHGGPGPKVAKNKLVIPASLPVGGELQSAVLLFSCPAAKKYLFYNLLGLHSGAVLVYFGYKHYIRHHVFKTGEIEMINGITVSKPDFSQYRIHISVASVSLGLLLLFGTLRYTLFSIRSLLVTGDRKNLKLTTLSFFGKEKQKIVPVSDVFAKSIASTLRGEESSLVQIKGEKIGYILDKKGISSCPNLLTDILCVRKPFVRD